MRPTSKAATSSSSRLLLVLNGSLVIAGDGAEWVGRCFMEHPRDRALTLRPLFARNLASVGAVTIDSSSRPDLNAHHHAGTTRRHDDPNRGVGPGRRFRLRRRN